MGQHFLVLKQDMEKFCLTWNSFKENLLKVDHPNPMIFLPGFDSKVINSMMDYIYNGEVKLFQNEIDIFLDSAKKLKIEGLTESIDDKLNFRNESSSINQALDVNDENDEKHYQEQKYST